MSFVIFFCFCTTHSSQQSGCWWHTITYCFSICYMSPPSSSNEHTFHPKLEYFTVHLWYIRRIHFSFCTPVLQSFPKIHNSSIMAILKSYICLAFLRHNITLLSRIIHSCCIPSFSLTSFLSQHRHLYGKAIENLAHSSRVTKTLYTMSQLHVSNEI